MIIRDNNHAIHGSWTVYNGLPHGSILSLILFNVYSAELLDLVDAELKIMPYADDICLYFSHNTSDKCLLSLE